MAKPPPQIPVSQVPEPKFRVTVPSVSKKINGAGFTDLLLPFKDRDGKVTPNKND